MARVEIRHKCIMIAREAARRDSRAGETGRSVFIKRYYGSYRLLAVEVSEKQRSCRDLFAEAQKLASRELRKWNKKRHWERMAKRCGVKGAHRMAVKEFYRMLKDGGGEEREEAVEMRDIVEENIRVRDGRMDWESRSRMSIRRRRIEIYAPLP